MRNAKLDQTNLINAILEGSDLRLASITSADLEGANLEGANLEGANLSFSILVEANLRRANLERVLLQETALIDYLNWMLLAYSRVQRRIHLSFIISLRVFNEGQ